ncbi:MarR family winged helix-turn-helix transcriptional regulator [Kutzneria sp. NPDC052558]|uniref:MarR family winged helix-turn-helix transcriptional regulator n=1 Tax=Kutzneria sp. NPDC052558 TaxID=3364121 RepID=UPI0037CC45B9
MPETAGAKAVYPVSDEELARFSWLGRDSSLVTVMFHARVAEQLGLSTTDHKCLDLAARGGQPMTAGRIAELSGLSTGAVTGVIDRLERAGYVRRVRDPHDRRKVLVEVTLSDPQRFALLFKGVSEMMARVLSHYTPEQRELLFEYGSEVLAQMRKEIAKFAVTD